MLRGIHPQEADATLHLKSSRIPMMSTVVWVHRTFTRASKFQQNDSDRDGIIILGFQYSWLGNEGNVGTGMGKDPRPPTPPSPRL
jgi:hypothetical protein